MEAKLLLQHDRVDWDARLDCLETSTSNPRVEVRTSWGLVPLRTAGLRAAGGRQVLGRWLERRPKEGPGGKGRPPRPKQLAAPDSHTGSHEADRDPLGFAICRTISAGLDPLSIESFTVGISQPGWRATRLSLHHLTIFCQVPWAGLSGTIADTIRTCIWLCCADVHPFIPLTDRETPEFTLCTYTVAVESLPREDGCGRLKQRFMNRVELHARVHGSPRRTIHIVDSGSSMR